MIESEDKGKIHIYEGKDYLVEYSGSSLDYPHKFKELKGEEVIDFLKELDKNREVSEIELLEMESATDDEAFDEKNFENLYCITYIYDSPKYGLHKVYRRMVWRFIDMSLNRYRGEEKEGNKVSEVTLLRLKPVTKVSINWFFRDFSRRIKDFDYSTIKKRANKS